MVVNALAGDNIRQNKQKSAERQSKTDGSEFF